MTTLFRSQTLAFLPNSRLKTPIVPGPHTSCVIRMSAFTQILSPACVRALPAARARIFSVNVIKVGRLPQPCKVCNSGISGIRGKTALRAKAGTPGVGTADRTPPARLLGARHAAQTFSGCLHEEVDPQWKPPG